MDLIEDAERATHAFHREAMSNRAKEGPTVIGACYNCGASLTHPHRWCDTNCRDDWQDRAAREPIRAIAGA